MIYVVSDIHGQFNKFEKLLKEIDFSKNDTLYILGDIIDRGPQNVKIIDKVMQTENIHMLIGNHEDMLLQYYKTKDVFNRELWYQNGGEHTDKEFKKLNSRKQKEIICFLENLPIEISLTVNNCNYLLVHGDYVSEKNKKFLDEIDYRNNVIWGRIKEYDEGPKDKIVVFGHTPVYHYKGTDEPLTFWKNGNLIGIDCGMAAYSVYPDICRLGCLCLDTLKEYYI